MTDSEFADLLRFRSVSTKLVETSIRRFHLAMMEERGLSIEKCMRGRLNYSLARRELIKLIFILHRKDLSTESLRELDERVDRRIYRVITEDFLGDCIKYFPQFEEYPIKSMHSDFLENKDEM